MRYPLKRDAVSAAARALETGTVVMLRVLRDGSGNVAGYRVDTCSESALETARECTRLGLPLPAETADALVGGRV